VYVDYDRECEAKAFDIDVSCIRTVTINPWMPRPLLESVRETIQSIEECRRLRVADALNGADDIRHPMTDNTHLAQRTKQWVVRLQGFGWEVHEWEDWMPEWWTKYNNYWLAYGDALRLNSRHVRGEDYYAELRTAYLMGDKTK
jgi:hypothetical protein